MATPRPAPEPQQQRSIETRRRLLDAAVEELLENGYGRVTTVSVAKRAAVTRGAQQHHFPNKDVLVAEAVRHLARRQGDELAAQLAALGCGRRRVPNALDLIYAQYGGPLFAAMFELSLAARHEPALRDLVKEEEHGMAATVHALGREVFGADALTSPDFAARWAAALATIRGIAVLRILGHSDRVLQRQWRFARGQILASLSAG